MDTTAAAAANLRYTIDAAAGAGAALAVTRHLEAPLKTVPPYLSMAYSSSQVIKGEIDMCSVEPGPMYLGVRGVALPPPHPVSHEHTTLPKCAQHAVCQPLQTPRQPCGTQQRKLQPLSP